MARERYINERHLPTRAPPHSFTTPKSNPRPKQPQHNPNTTSPQIHKQSPAMALPAYIISRTLDPIFALFIGLGAASMRINREEKELGRSTKETIDAGLR